MSGYGKVVMGYGMGSNTAPPCDNSSVSIIIWKTVEDMGKVLLKSCRASLIQYEMLSYMQ